MDKEGILQEIVRAGFAFASTEYENWYENHVLCSEDDSFYESVDENNNPYEDYFRDYIVEASNQAYIDCGPEGNVLNGFDVENVSRSDILDVLDENLYNYVWDGIEQFIKETYHNK